MNKIIKKLPFHYGWIMTFTGLLQVACCCMFSTSFAVSLAGMRSELGFTGVQTSLFITIRSFTGLLIVMIMDRYFKRFGLRRGIPLAMGVGALGMLLYGLAGTNVWLCYAASALGGIPFGLCMMASVSILMKNWFNRHRGLCLAICSSGTGLANIIVIPLLQHIISNRGIRAAFYVQALIFVAIAGLVFLLLRETPAEVGLEPVGGADAEAGAAAGRRGGRSGGSTAQTVFLDNRSLIMMACALFLMGMGASPTASHLVVTFTWEGIDPMTVAVGASVTGACLIVGKLSYGVVSDRFGNRAAAVMFAVIILVGYFSIFSIMFAPASAAVALMFIGSAGHGIGGSICHLGYPAWAADYSSAEDYTRTLKKFQTGYQFGTLVGSPLPGLVCDLTGTYCWYYLVPILGYGLTVLCCVWLYAKLKRKRAACA